MAEVKTFQELWREIEERSRRWAIPIVQDYKELEYVFNLMKGCNTYLEIGTAEGNSLYVLAHALNPCKIIDNPFNLQMSIITYLDYGEKHTEAAREEAIKWAQEADRPVSGILSNSHAILAINATRNSKYDCVMIDAGHTYEDVIADAIAYGHLATKYIFFHDIQLPPVRAAYDWYLKQNPQFKHHEFINSTTYGYGIVEV